MALLQLNFASKALNRQTTVSVILPQADEKASDGWKCQTLWLLHGMQGDATDWLRFTSIERYAEENHLMVVMPGVDNSFYANTAYRVNYWTYLSEELWQVLQAWFPCFSSCREDQFVAGLSMGAGGAMKYAVNHPERFSQAVCLSGGSLTMEDQETIFFRQDGPIPEFPPAMGNLERIRGTEDDVFCVAKKHAEKGSPLPTIHFAVGSDDPILWSVKKASAQLSQLGWPVTYLEIPGYQHEWSFWDLAIQKTIQEWLPLKRKLF